MPADEILMDAEERMEKAVAHLGDSLSGIRTGRATPGLVDSIRVEVYGSMQPLKQLASIGTPEPQQIVIRPYDAGTIKEIEKAIVAGDLGLNPQNDGRIIRLNVPVVDGSSKKMSLRQGARGGLQGFVAEHPSRRKQICGLRRKSQGNQ